MTTQRIQVEVLEIQEKKIHVRFHGTEAWLPRWKVEKMKQVGNKADIVIPAELFDEKFDS